MGERVESWIHTQRPFDPKAEEERMSNEQALAIYELERCIECGCCLAACGTAQMRPDFIGAAGMLRIARFLVDPRDQRADADYFEVVGTDEGVFGCIGLLGCEDYCPKKLPNMTQIAYLRRKMTLAALRGKRIEREARLRASFDDVEPGCGLPQGRGGSTLLAPVCSYYFLMMPKGRMYLPQASLITCAAEA